MKFVRFQSNFFPMKIFKLSVICIFIALSSCSTNKKLYDSKEYDKVLNNLTDRASKNELNESQIEMLSLSYHQANQDDFMKIIELKKSGLPDIWTEIYYRTYNINERQNKVDKLPDNIKDSINYKRLALEDEIRSSKIKAETYLSAKANQLLRNPNEDNINESEVLIKQLHKINPNNSNLEDLHLRLIFSSADNILFRIATPTDLYLPDDFALLALNFEENTIYNVPFDVVPNENTDYDLMIRVMIEEKNISPERIDAVTFEERNGDKTAKVTDRTMNKTATITGQIEVIDVKNEDILIITPFDISSTFSHKYAIFEGDREACSEQTLSLLSNEAIDFPSDNALFRDIARKLNDALKSYYQKK